MIPRFGIGLVGAFIFDLILPNAALAHRVAQELPGSSVVHNVFQSPQIQAVPNIDQMDTPLFTELLYASDPGPIEGSVAVIQTAVQDLRQEILTIVNATEQTLTLLSTRGEANSRGIVAVSVPVDLLSIAVKLSTQGILIQKHIDNAMMSIVDEESSLAVTNQLTPPAMLLGTVLQRLVGTIMITNDRMQVGASVLSEMEKASVDAGKRAIADTELAIAAPFFEVAQKPGVKLSASYIAVLNMLKGAVAQAATSASTTVH
ncbi:hypothetical protein BDY21DRAFT_373388 [Lineolata rhizophorae]|uniref:Uncharacterized protein n=1 Tax=Lineolata rhizophorae TaxID=578093 RepID=A0A6A6NU64_9PEZI|nr:hypothetical protein BDY21DRAFT_373388 [Lineolata rhizophorae]